MTPNLDKAVKWSLTTDETVDALNELVGLAEYGTARITIFAGGGASVAIGSEHAASKFVGKTAEEALCKAQAAILKHRGAA